MRLKTFCFLFLAVVFSIFSFDCSSGTTGDKNKQDHHNPQDSAYDVFLVAGQSNTYYGLGLDTSIDKPSPGIYQLGRNGKDNMKVITATEPLHHYFTQPDRIGFALTFAKLYDKDQGYKRNILIIPCGMDWTGFADSSWKRGDCLYNDAVYRTNEVFRRYPKSKLVAILWSQGEKDVDNPKFTTSLDSMIAGYRKDITGANEKTPFVLGGMVPFWTERKEERVKQQERIKDTPKRMPYVAYADPYIPFRIEKRSNTVDEYHYNAEGQREMGKRFYEAYQKLR